MTRDPSQLTRELYDLLIIGGGITGTGIARDAALRGLKVALIEKGDIASGTSSKTSKLIHGGLRYLEHGALKLVFESCRERRLLQIVAPHLVTPLPFLIPIYQGDRHGRFQVNMGMWLYDLLASFRNTKRHQMTSARQASTLEPGLQATGLTGAALYYDCQMDDARLCVENAMSSAAHGAQIVNYMKVVALVKAHGKIVGVVGEDALSGERQTIRARCVVSATGPWFDQFVQLDQPGTRPILSLSQGIHLVVPSLTQRHALLIASRRDERIFFIFPWRGYSLIGTTDTPFRGDLDRVSASEEEIAYLLEETKRVLPRQEITRQMVIATYAGVRPLVATSHERLSEIPRDHRIWEFPSGLIAITGGKFTTHRHMAQEVVDRVMHILGRQGPRCMTDTVKLYGIEHDRSQELLSYVKDDPSLKDPIVAGQPYIKAEVIYAIEHEMAMTIADLYFRRTTLGLTIEGRRRDALETIVALCGRHWGWGNDRQAGELEALTSSLR